MDEHRAKKRLPPLDRYQAYLIRIWQDGQFGSWRASAQSVKSGETVRFASLERLFEFLQARTTEADE